MPTNYREVLRLLEISRTQLRPVSMPPQTEDVAVWLRRRHFAEIKAADAACEAFALHAEWPAIRLDSIVAHVRLRLESAIGLCQGMLHQSPPAHLDQRQLLRLLLLDYWHARVARFLAGLAARPAPVPAPVHPAPTGRTP